MQVTSLSKTVRTIGLVTILSTIAELGLVKTAQAQDQSVCFIQLPGKATTNLNKICGVGSNSSNQSNIINLDIDVDRDGVSDQLLAATLQTQNFVEAETKRWQANRGSDALANQMADEAYNATARNANLQLEARLPFSNQVKQTLGKMQTNDEIIQRRYDNRTLNPTEQQEVERLISINRKLSESIAQDPTLLKVNAAQSKVYAEIDRRRTTK